MLSKMRMLSGHHHHHHLPFEFPLFSGHFLSKGSLSPEGSLLKQQSANNNLLSPLSSLYPSAASSLFSRTSASPCSSSFSPIIISLQRRGAPPTGNSIVELRQLVRQRPAGGLEERRRSGEEKGEGEEEGGGGGGGGSGWLKSSVTLRPAHSTHESGIEYFFSLQRPLGRCFCSRTVSSGGGVVGKEEEEKKKKEETENAQVSLLSARVSRLRETMLSVDWSDYFALVLNEPFWRAELVSIEADFQALREVSDSSAAFPSASASSKESVREDLLRQTGLGQLQTLMDIFYQLEDVRDHLNEVLDYLSRTGGLAGTGAYPSPPLENVQQHVDALVAKYEELKKSASATYLPQIESVLGQGLALLRQKYKFAWRDMHRYSF